MFELFANILICLLPAFILGLIWGWLLWGMYLKPLKKENKKLWEALNSYENKVVSVEENPPIASLENLEELPSTPPALPFGIPYPKFDRKDDLKQIKGIDATIEQKLNAYGITTFEQVAYLNPNNILLLGTSFSDFPNRLTQQDWATQSIHLHQQTYPS